jgi:hypothetical protein
VTVRPSALASFIDELAGRMVRVRNARVVGMFNPRAFLIESATSVPVMLGTRNRLLVLVDESTALRVAPATIVGSNVIVFGVARTLLGVRVTSEVTWPPELAENVVKRLEVRGAVLAISVQTAEGVELTDRKNTRAQDREHRILLRVSFDWPGRLSIRRWSILGPLYKQPVVVDKSRTSDPKSCSMADRTAKPFACGIEILRSW